jgi:hypothetical protein
LPHRITATRRLDFDDLGAEIAKQLTTKRSRQ